MILATHGLEPPAENPIRRKNSRGQSYKFVPDRTVSAESRARTPIRFLETGRRIRRQLSTDQFLRGAGPESNPQSTMFVEVVHTWNLNQGAETGLGCCSTDRDIRPSFVYCSFVRSFLPLALD